MDIRVISNVSLMRAVRRSTLMQNRMVGLVPTMGALHKGHLDLIRQAAFDNDTVYVSVYVNPTQFGINEDLTRYPRTWAQDKAKLEGLQAEFRRGGARGRIQGVFLPDTKEMYPGLPPSSEIDGDGSFVTITPLARKLEGASRPVFFRGVATVVMKLLHIIQPERVYFGQKDIQQTYVIKQMVRDFQINSEVVVGPTVREDDGLAMSSRNAFLGERRRKIALVLLQALREVERLFAQGERQKKYLHRGAMDALGLVQRQQNALPPHERARFDIDYISIADVVTLDELEEVKSETGAIVSGAIKMLPIERRRPGEVMGNGDDEGPVRLIDNIRLDLLTAKLRL